MTDKSETADSQEQRKINALFATFPRLFAEEREAAYGIPADWRISCPESWLPIVDALCESLQWETDENGAPQLVIHRVKVKFGSLRVQTSWPRSERQEAMIEFALRLSLRIPDSDQ